MTVVRQHLATAFLIVIGMIAYGCGDSATTNPDATLANLTVTTDTATITLDPVFNPGTTSYTANLSNNLTAVTITAQPAVAGDTITIDGQTTTSTSIDLGQPVPTESTKVVNVVVSNPPSSSRTYTVLLKRAGLDGNNSLQALTVSPGVLAPTFNANTQTYTVDVANTAGSVTVTPTLQDTAATMTVNGQGTSSGQARTVNLNGPGQSTVFPIIVTAQNGNQKTYTVTVSRGISSNNNLQGLTVSPGSLSPTYNASRASTSYTVNVGSTVANITVTPTRQDSNATITMNGTPATSGQGRSIPLNGAGSNTVINIVVTAQNGTQKTYSVNVVRAALGGNNNLSALTVSPGSLNSPFDPTDQTYSVNVASTVTSMNVSATKADPNAVMSGSLTAGAGTASAQTSIQLGGPGTTSVVSITVTAPNGSSKAYTITVERAALASNNNLSALSVTPGPLAPAFAQNTLNYTVNAASTVSSVNVSATKADSNSVMSDDVTAGAGTATGQGTIQLGGQGTATVVLITVTAPNGNSKTYRITVNRALPSSNNSLSALTVSQGSLAPSFDAATENYTVGVATDVSSINVSATKADANAVMSGSVTAGTGVSTGQATIPLNGAGTSTPVSITVTAPNGSSKTYTVTVNRALAEPPAPSVAPDLITADDSCAPGVPDPAVCAPGTSREDNVTNVTTPGFSIPQPGSGETATLYINGNKDTSSSTTGNLLRPSTSLSDGTYTITYTLNSSGGESNQSPPLTVTINTVAPGQ